MAKKVAALLAMLVLIGAGLYLAGVGVGLDGSGSIPRFISRAPDFDALEADRARQRAAAPSPGTDVPPASTITAAAAPTSSPATAPSTPSPVVERASWPDFRGRHRDG